MTAFWKELLIRLTVCSLCIKTICILFISHFGLEGETLVLIAPVPGHCLPFYFLFIYHELESHDDDRTDEGLNHCRI